MIVTNHGSFAEDLHSQAAGSLPKGVDKDTSSRRPLDRRQGQRSGRVADGEYSQGHAGPHGNGTSSRTTQSTDYKDFPQHTSTTI